MRSGRAESSYAWAHCECSCPIVDMYILSESENFRLKRARRRNTRLCGFANGCAGTLARHFSVRGNPNEVSGLAVAVARGERGWCGVSANRALYRVGRAYASCMQGATWCRKARSGGTVQAGRGLRLGVGVGVAEWVSRLSVSEIKEIVAGPDYRRIDCEIRGLVRRKKAG